MVLLSHKKSGIVLKLWHFNANSVDVLRLNILSSGLLDPIGTSLVLTDGVLDDAILIPPHPPILPTN